MTNILKKPFAFKYFREQDPALQDLAAAQLVSYRKALDDVPTEGSDPNWILSLDERASLVFAIDDVLERIRARLPEDPQYAINTEYIYQIAALIETRPTDETWA